MELFDCGSGEAATRRWEAYVRQRQKASLPVSRGRAAPPEGGLAVGCHSWHVNHLFVVVKGEAWACGGDRSAVRVGEGRGAFWRAGEWFAFGVDRGTPAEVLMLESDDLSPHRFVDHGRELT